MNFILLERKIYLRFIAKSRFKYFSIPLCLIMIFLNIQFPLYFIILHHTACLHLIFTQC